MIYFYYKENEEDVFKELNSKGYTIKDKYLTIDDRNFRTKVVFKDNEFKFTLSSIKLSKPYIKARKFMNLYTVKKSAVQYEEAKVAIDVRPGTHYIDDIHSVYNFAVTNNLPTDVTYCNGKLSSVKIYSGYDVYDYVSFHDFSNDDVKEIKSRFKSYGIDLGVLDLHKTGTVARTIHDQLDNDEIIPADCLRDISKTLVKNSAPFSYIGCKRGDDIICDGLKLDIVSSYPSTYVNALYPSGRCFKVHSSKYNSHLERFSNKSELGIVVFNAELRIKNGNIPFIHTNNILPEEHYRPSYLRVKNYAVTSERFNLIREIYNVENLEIVNMYYFEGVRNGIAHNFVSRLIDIKNNESGVVKLYAKLVLNSLNGQFAYSGDSVRIESFNKEESKINRFHSMRSYMYCFTLDYAVERIYKDAVKVKEDLIYCNVDSLFLRNKRYDLNIGNNLGQYKIEDEIKRARVINYGQYIINDTIKCIAVSNTEGLNFDNFKPGLEIKENQYSLVDGLYKKRTVTKVLGRSLL